jgi:hypothetical protein
VLFNGQNINTVVLNLFLFLCISIGLAFGAIFLRIDILVCCQCLVTIVWIINIQLQNTALNLHIVLSAHSIEVCFLSLLRVLCKAVYY